MKKEPVLFYGVIFGAGISAAVISNAFYCAYTGHNFGFALLFFVIAALYCGLASGAVTLILHNLPKRLFDYRRKIFAAFAFEGGLYKALGVKSWKDRVPELGKLSNFRKNRVYEPDNPVYLYKFLEQNCIAEWLHLLSILLSAAAFFIMPAYFILTCALPAVLTNAVLHGLPYIIQRYLRPKLITAYEYALKKERRAKERTGAGEGAAVS